MSTQLQYLVAETLAEALVAFGLVREQEIATWVRARRVWTVAYERDLNGAGLHIFSVHPDGRVEFGEGFAERLIPQHWQYLRRIIRAVSDESGTRLYLK